MNSIQFSAKNTLTPVKDLKKISPKCDKKTQVMKKALEKGYNDDHASIYLPSDEEGLVTIKKVIAEKSKLKPAAIIVVGIGGSNLGTIAVQEAVFGKLYNQLTTGTKIFYADTVDTDTINDIRLIIEPLLKKGKRVILNAVSKSGGTTETIANFEVLLHIIKKYDKNYRDSVVITTNKDSKFELLAKKNKFSTLEIPVLVGGRDSVLSAVGLFPLGLIGIDIDELVRGAKDIQELTLSSKAINNPAAISAINLFLAHKQKITIHDHFVFSNDLESVGKWYRQLMGESIGKEFNLKKKRVFAGITPTVSIGSTDLHSMAQLYLGGPYDKITTFISINPRSDLKLPTMKAYDALVPKIQGRSLQELMDAILQGVKNAFKKGKRPYMEIELGDKSEYSIGMLLQLKMFEIVYLADLMGVNPFNQPNVESYKIETKKILKKK